MLYLTVTYGIGKELTFTNGATVMSEPSARFVAGAQQSWGPLAGPGLQSRN